MLAVTVMQILNGARILEGVKYEEGNEMSYSILAVSFFKDRFFLLDITWREQLAASQI